MHHCFIIGQPAGSCGICIRRVAGVKDSYCLCAKSILPSCSSARGDHNQRVALWIAEQDRRGNKSCLWVHCHCYTPVPALRGHSRTNRANKVNLHQATSLLYWFIFPHSSSISLSAPADLSLDPCLCPWLSLPHGHLTRRGIAQL